MHNVEEPDQASSKKGIYLLVVVILFIFLGVFVYFVAKNKYLSPSQNTGELTPTSSPKPVKALPFPKASFSAWTLSNNLITVTPKAQSQVFSLKQETSLIDTDVDAMTQALKIKGEKKKVGDYVLIEQSDKNNPSLLVFHPQSGSLTFFSVLGIDTGTSNVMTEDNLSSYLKQNKLSDDTITVTATYKKKSVTGITYYELHRDWSKVGYPILNPIGLLNLPENQLLSTLSLQNKLPNQSEDTEIYNSSDSKDGLQRADDFNTMTVAVDDTTGNILSIKSNIRPLIKATNYAQTELMTQDEAVKKLQAGDHNIFVSTPSGDGAPDFAKVYPDNKVAGEAVIDEVIIAYLEKPGGTTQTSLEPYYVFKGYSDASSGYRIRFIAGVSAVKGLERENLSFKGEGQVAGAMIAQGVQQDTMTFSEITITSTPVPFVTTESTPTSVPEEATPLTPTLIPEHTTPAEENIINPEGRKDFCPSLSDFKEIRVHEGIKYGLVILSNYSVWFYIPDSKDIKTKKEDVELILKKIQKFIEDTNTQNLADNNGQIVPIRDLDYTRMEYNAVPKCPIRITGNSPSVFFYAPPSQEYQLSINKPITYNDPSLLNNKWNIKLLGNNQLLVNQLMRNYIYYEYEPVSYTKPKTGWTIEKSDIQSLASKIASQLKLNNTETERLVFELKHASFNIKNNYLFIGLIPQDEVDTKLPLAIQPSILNIQRYHFFVEGLDDKEETVQPELKSVLRTQPMIFEVGAVSNLKK